MNIFNSTDTKEEIIEKIDNAQGVSETIQIGIAFLGYKFQEELLKSQNDYNSKQLYWSRVLAIATIFLFFATLLLVRFS